MLSLRRHALLLALALAACGTPAAPADDASTDARANGPTDAADAADVDPLADVVIPERQPGERAPLSAACDAVDPARCLLPWPSNVYTTRDPATPTGLRVAIAATSLPGGMRDTAEPLARGDGFSRVSPVLTVLAGELDPASLGGGTDGAVRVFVAQPGQTLGEPVPVRIVATRGSSARGPETLLTAYPLRPFAANTDYVAVVLDAAHRADGTPVPQTPAAQAALALRAPSDLAEAHLRAYHAPTRAALARAGIDPARVVRVWDFTTRSADDPRRALRTVREATVGAVDAARVTLAIDSVVVPTDNGSVAVVVEGRLQNLPNFVTASAGLRYDAAGAPEPVGTHDAPFRVALPRGTGDYRVTMFGHGLGGSVHDDSFDTDITAAGAAKVGVAFAGLTEKDIQSSIAGLTLMVAGIDRVAARLVQSLADGMAIQRALRTVLGDALAAPTLGGSANPVAGRRPRADQTMWAGGSLGGTMGLVYCAAEGDIVAGVLNVPGAAWSHFLPLSSLFGAVTLVLRANYRTDIDALLAVSLSQSLWDPADGGSWADVAVARGVPLLVQESIGDPVLPNVGSDLVAVAVDAVQLGASLAPVTGVHPADEAVGRNGFTQYHVPTGGAYEVHGFAARDTPAGRAARTQIIDFTRSVWANAPRITLPAACRDNTPANSCDFSAGP